MTKLKDILWRFWRSRSLGFTVGRIGLLVYVGLGILILAFQRQAIYRPDKSDFWACRGFGESEKIDLGEGTRAYWRHMSNQLVVFYHGNAGSACDRSALKDIFASLDYSYLFVEYTGYAGDARAPTRAALLKDVERVHAFVQTTAANRLVVAGESIGSALALYHASLLRDAQVLLIAPFDSLAGVAREHYPVYPMSLLLYENYDATRWVKSVGRARIIHGTEDRIIPMRRGKDLFDAFPTPHKIFTQVPGAGHNDIYEFGQTLEAMREFLQ